MRSKSFLPWQLLWVYHSLVNRIAGVKITAFTTYPSYPFFMKISLTLLFTALSCCVFAQTLDTKMPAVVPPSPEIAELSRYMDVKSNLFTGASNVNIPLYELKTGSITTQVALAYSNNGIKVTDIPSRAGMGWNLIAGGMITRTVRDEPDELSTKLAPLDFANVTSAPTYLQYLRSATSYDYDTEQDIYNINAPGISSQFFFDSSNVPRLISHSNIKITVIGSPTSGIDEFYITDGNGIKYYFGENGAIEQTREVVLSGTSPKYKIQKTGWFLTRIVSPEGYSVNYSYNPIYFKTNQGPSQFVILQSDGYIESPCNKCEPTWQPVQYTLIDYDSQYLTSITTSKGQGVSFQYEQRPDDSGDNRIKSITSVQGDKAYNFGYLDITGSGYELNKRFYLQDIKTIPTDNQTDTVKHSFEYYYPENFPIQTSLSQDYSGYNNGVRNTNYFPNIYNTFYRRSEEGANRRPNFGEAKSGSLKKVTYPTGGSDEFVYEPHTLSQIVTDTVWKSLDIWNSGIGLHTADIDSATFKTTLTQTISVGFYFSEMPNASSSPYYNPPTGQRLADLEIWDVTIGERIFYHRNAINYNTIYTNLFAEAGHTYRIKINVWGETHKVGVYFKYDPLITSVPQNVPVSGIRVAYIKSNDPITGQKKYKHFTYASLADLGRSSGFGRPLIANSEVPPLLGGWCLQHGGGTQMYDLVICKSILGVSGATYPNPQDFSGSPIAYKYVIESDEPAFANGGIEHSFNGSNISTGVIGILNQPSLNSPSMVEPNLNGVEKGTITFKQTLNGNTPVQETQNLYAINMLPPLIMNYNVKKNWDFTQLGDNTTLVTLEDKLKGFVIGGYRYRGGVQYLQQTKTINYDQNGGNPRVDSTIYEYNADYTLQTKITSSNSNGYITETSLKYPANYTTSPYTGMVLQNNLNPVIEQTIVKKIGVTTMPVSILKADYKNWSTTLYGIYKPEYIKQQIGAGPLTNKIRYYAYDGSGNPLEVSQESGPHVAYIYDNLNFLSDHDFLPIAEVTNATVSSVAFTSFEGTRKGGWVYGDTKATDANTPVGGFCYNLSAGSISKTGLTSTEKYIVSYWSKNTTAYTITGTVSGYPVKVRSKNGWMLYVHLVTGVSTVAINAAGLNLIDEVKIYPENAQMKTFAYNFPGNVISSTDAKNATSYYEYDGLQRLKNIKDQNGNILKNYSYKYLKIGNQLRTGTYRKQCTTGIGSEVTYTVPAGRYTGATQEEANALAQADIEANGQAYANTNGVCSMPYVKMTLTATSSNTNGDEMHTYTASVYADSGCTVLYPVTSTLTVLYKNTKTTIVNGQPTISSTNLYTTISAGNHSRTLTIMGNSCNGQTLDLQAGSPDQPPVTETVVVQETVSETESNQQAATGEATTNGFAPVNCEYSYLTLRPSSSYWLPGTVD